MSEQTSQPGQTKRKRILITGASGTVGTALRKHLRERYDFRLLDYPRPTEGGEGDQIVIADIANFEQMLEAARGVDAIVHLALAGGGRGRTEAQRAQQTIEVDVRGLHNVFEAARLNGVNAVVFASTNHVTGLNEEDGVVSHPDAPVRPDGIYGAAKAFGEALGRLYADRRGVRVFCIRIANFNGKDEPGRDYEPGRSRWLSPRDLAQLVWRSLESSLHWGIFYGVSGGGEQKWDLTNARELLGYEPLDNGSLEEHREKYRQ